MFQTAMILQDHLQKYVHAKSDLLCYPLGQPTQYPLIFPSHG